MAICEPSRKINSPVIANLKILFHAENIGVLINVIDGHQCFVCDHLNLLGERVNAAI